MTPRGRRRARRWGAPLRLLAGLALTLMAARPAAAMQLSVVGDQVILTGPVVGDEYGKLVAALAANPGVTTVILRDSLGGDVRTGYRIGALLRDRGLHTAVSGYCYSSCSRMFLGGKTRVFTNDYPPDFTNVGFHGHYNRDGRLNAALVDRMGLRNWIIRYSDGKADPALVAAWVDIPVNWAMVHVYHPTRLTGHGATTFFCHGNEPTRVVFACEPVHESALALGVITSLAVIASNDQAALRATFPPPPPPPSNYAALNDLSRLPAQSETARRNYRRFLAAPLPRGFAVSLDGTHFAWNAGDFDARATALARCVAAAGDRPCRLYAVDQAVVW
jgi:hypothetical protein